MTTQQRILLRCIQTRLVSNVEADEVCDLLIAKEWAAGDKTERWPEVQR
jgi:hypothetical protein